MLDRWLGTPPQDLAALRVARARVLRRPIQDRAGRRKIRAARPARQRKRRRAARRRDQRACLRARGRRRRRAGRRLRLLIYGINYAPELTGIGKYSGDMAEWLAAAGHDVRVVTAPPYYPDWAVWPGYSGSRYTRERLNGVTVIRTPLWVPRKVNGLRRLLHLASFALASAPALIAQWRWKPDVVWVTEPPLFARRPRWPSRGCVRPRPGFIYRITKSMPPSNSACSRAGGCAASSHRCERWLMRSFDRVSTISPAHDRARRRQGRGRPAACFRCPTGPTSRPSGRCKCPAPIARNSAWRPTRSLPSIRATWAPSRAWKCSPRWRSFCMSAPDPVRVLRQWRRPRRPDGPLRRPEQRALPGSAAGRAPGRSAGPGGYPSAAAARRCRRPGHALQAHRHAQQRPAGSGGRTAGHRAGQGRRAVGRTVAPEDSKAFAEAIAALASDAALRQELGLRARAFAEERVARDAVLAQFESDLYACIADRR